MEVVVPTKAIRVLDWVTIQPSVSEAIERPLGDLQNPEVRTLAPWEEATGRVRGIRREKDVVRATLWTGSFLVDFELPAGHERKLRSLQEERVGILRTDLPGPASFVIRKVNGDD